MDNGCNRIKVDVLPLQLAHGAGIGRSRKRHGFFLQGGGLFKKIALEEGITVLYGGMILLFRFHLFGQQLSHGAIEAAGDGGPLHRGGQAKVYLDDIDQCEQGIKGRRAGIIVQRKAIPFFLKLTQPPDKRIVDPAVLQNFNDHFGRIGQQDKIPHDERLGEVDKSRQVARQLRQAENGDGIGQQITGGAAAVLKLGGVLHVAVTVQQFIANDALASVKNRLPGNKPLIHRRNILSLLNGQAVTAAGPAFGSRRYPRF